VGAWAPVPFANGSSEVYPTHDFASPILDHCDGVTHVLRSTDHLDKHEQYMWFVERLGLRQTVISHLP
jgi:glutamyl/glutaminyl-tRNA synthetase